MNFSPIPPFDLAAAQSARTHQALLTKPSGALGYLEELSIQLAGMTGNPRPRFHQKGVIGSHDDHGIAKEGVSAYPPEVTPQMVLNFLQGGAAVNVLARQANATVKVVDIGVAYDFHGVAGLIHRNVAPGTRSLRTGPAITRAQAEDAIQVGMDVVEGEIAAGLDLVATGDMGIGNTTPSSAITAVLTGLPVEQVTGRGTGIDEAGLCKKIQVIEEAIRVNAADPRDAMDVLAKLGGLEIAGLAALYRPAALENSRSWKSPGGEIAWLIFKFDRWTQRGAKSALPARYPSPTVCWSWMNDLELDLLTIAEESSLLSVRGSFERILDFLSSGHFQKEVIRQFLSVYPEDEGI